MRHIQRDWVVCLLLAANISARYTGQRQEAIHSNTRTGPPHLPAPIRTLPLYTSPARKSRVSAGAVTGATRATLAYATCESTTGSRNPTQPALRRRLSGAHSGCDQPACAHTGSGRGGKAPQRRTRAPRTARSQGPRQQRQRRHAARVPASARPAGRAASPPLILRVSNLLSWW